MTLLPRTAQSLFKMHPPRGGNDFRARGSAPPQTFNDLFEFLAERPCVGPRQTEDAPSTICVGVCDRGSKRGVEEEAWWIQCANRSLKIPEHCRLFRSTAECLEYLCWILTFFSHLKVKICLPNSTFFSIRECDETTALKFCTFNRSTALSTHGKRLKCV